MNKNEDPPVFTVPAIPANPAPTLSIPVNPVPTLSIPSSFTYPPPPAPPLTIPADLTEYDELSPTYSDDSTPRGSPSLPEISDLVRYLNRPEIADDNFREGVPKSDFIAKLTSSLQNIQDLSDVCVANLERLNNSIPTEAGIDREPNNGDVDPNPIEFAIKVIIIVLTYLPFLIFI